KRAGISRRVRPVREPANSYEWPCPGDLLHMDVSRYARFLRPGHRVTGDRSQRSRDWMRPETRVGYDYAHAIVDDHSRLAYVELHPDEKAATVTGFVERALDFFAEHEIAAKRLMTDHGWSYVRNRSLQELLAEPSGLAGTPPEAVRVEQVPGSLHLLRGVQPDRARTTCASPIERRHEQASTKAAATVRLADVHAFELHHAPTEIPERDRADD